MESKRSIHRRLFFWFCFFVVLLWKIDYPLIVEQTLGCRASFSDRKMGFFFSQLLLLLFSFEIQLSSFCLMQRIDSQIIPATCPLDLSVIFVFAQFFVTLISFLASLSTWFPLFRWCVSRFRERVRDFQSCWESFLRPIWQVSPAPRTTHTHKMPSPNSHAVWTWWTFFGGWLAEWCHRSCTRRLLFSRFFSPDFLIPTPLPIRVCRLSDVCGSSTHEEEPLRAGAVCGSRYNNNTHTQKTDDGWWWKTNRRTWIGARVAHRVY